jgi:hypothetical protein
MNGTQWCVVFPALVTLTASVGAFAQEHARSEFSGHEGPAIEDGHRAFGEHGVPGSERIHSEFAQHDDPAHEHFDARFSHNRAYLDHGYRVPEAPRGGYTIDLDRDHYSYDRGVWYRREGLDWVVVGAPVGAFVSVLPPFFTTVLLGGVPYYYANDAYYSLNGDQNEYEVVAPPAGIDSASTGQPAPDGQLFVYPKNGATSAQQASDRYECDISAADNTGFDPTQEDGGVSPDAAPAKQADYFRAETACLQVRGYRVR